MLYEHVEDFFIARQIYECYNITFELALKLTVLTKCFRVSQKGNVSIIKGQCQNDSCDFLQHNILKVCVCVRACVCVCVCVCVCAKYERPCAF